MPSKSESQVVIRAASPADAEICGGICYEAFLKLSAKHGFPCDFPGAEAPRAYSRCYSRIRDFIVWLRKAMVASWEAIVSMSDL